VREQDRRRAAIGRPGEHLKRAAPLSGIARHPDTIARMVSRLMVAGWVLPAILGRFFSSSARPIRHQARCSRTAMSSPGPLQLAWFLISIKSRLLLLAACALQTARGASIARWRL
jgi:hypothetical protein